MHVNDGVCGDDRRPVLPETLMSERLSVKFYTVPWLANDNRMCRKVQTQAKVLSLQMENCESLQLV